jgi:hypothetical protein
MAFVRWIAWDRHGKGSDSGNESLPFLIDL